MITAIRIGNFKAFPEIHAHELLIDGQSLLRMSRRRDGKLQLDRLDHEHPVFREVVKAMVLLPTTTETVHPEDFEGLDEAIAELVPEVVAKSTQFLPEGKGRQAERSIRNRFAAWPRGPQTGDTDACRRTMGKLRQSAEKARQIRQEKQKRDCKQR